MVRKLAEGAADLFVAVAAAWALAWKLTRDRWGILGLANAWAFWLLVTALPVGLFRLGRRSRWLAAGWLVGVLALLFRRYTFAVPQGSRRRRASRVDSEQAHSAHDEVALKLLSFNLLKENLDAGAVVALIVRESPDLVLIQELEAEMRDALERDLEAAYPYGHYAQYPEPGAGLGVYARLPFDVSGLLPSGGRRPYALRITLNLGAASVDIYNVHLLPTAGEILFKMGPTANFRLRTQQAHDLVNEIRLRQQPALALGDYNLTEGSEGYRVLASGLTDAWRVAGRGMGWTWPRTLAPYRDMTAQPLLRIDYCFCTHDVIPLRMRVLRDLLGSDHCPIVVEARVPVPEAGFAIATGWPVPEQQELVEQPKATRSHRE